MYKRYINIIIIIIIIIIFAVRPNTKSYNNTLYYNFCYIQICGR